MIGGGHSACKVPQGRMDDTGRDKGDIPSGTEGAGGSTVERQTVHILLPDDRVGDRGTVEVEVRHGQGAWYQYNVLVPYVVVTTAAADGMEVRIGLSREGQAVQVYTIGHW